MITGYFSGRVESRLEPLNLTGLDPDDVEAAGRLLRQARQEVARGKHDPPLLGPADASGGAAESRAGPAPDLDKHQRAVAIAHHQVDFPAAAAGRPIIARHQPQARRFEMGKRPVLGGVAGLLGGDRLSGEIH